MNKLKEKGITLVALVITIIILLILAGVTINSALSENGLFQKAKYSVEKYKEAEDQESQVLDEFFMELLDGEAEQVTDENPGELRKENNDENVLIVESIEDLVALSEKVKGGETYENKTIKLNINLDFNSDLSYVDPEKEGIKTSVTTGEGFIPIGNNSNIFNGTFDGRGHTIKNLYIKSTSTDPVGLFGKTGSQSTIKNLILSKGNVSKENGYVGTLAGTIEGTNIENVKVNGGSVKGNERIGGLIGSASGGTINKCENNSYVEGGRFIGGLIGQGSNGFIMENCKNNGKILGTGVLDSGDNQLHSHVGGLVGESKGGQLKKSKNNGQVDGSGIGIAGIAAICWESTLIYDCFNAGNIRGSLNEDKKGLNVGGIAGGLTDGSTVLCCYNLASVEGRGFVGGIVGLQGWNGYGYIKNCYNFGSILAYVHSVGGISCVDGSTKTSEVKNCYNIGKVTSESGNPIYYGGILTTTSNDKTIVSNCYYLEGSCDIGISGVTDEEGKAMKKSENDMKSNQFVDKLNEGNETIIWGKDEKNINKGFPVLK